MPKKRIGSLYAKLQFPKFSGSLASSLARAKAMDVEVPSVSNVYGPGSWVMVGAMGKCFGKVTRAKDVPWLIPKP